MTLDLIERLFNEEKDFAVETTLSGRLHQKIIREAHTHGYYVVLIYVWVHHKCWLPQESMQLTLISIILKFGTELYPPTMTSKAEHKIFIEKLMAGVHASMDKLILERMAMNRPLIVMRDGKIQKISPFQLAKERWGDTPPAAALKD